MARYLAIIDAKFLLEFFATCFYIGSSGMVLGSWVCPYLARVFTSGKHLVSPTGSNWVPKSKFLHFYIWGFITNLIVYMSADYKYDVPWARMMIIAHTIRRALEVIISTKRPGSKMNLFAYLYGLVFYTILPLVTFEESVEYRPIVMILFPIASLLQFIVHLVLGRKKAYDRNVGIIFRYANHIAELVIYICIYLISPSIPSLLMLIYVAFCMCKLMHLNYIWYGKKR